MTSTIDPGVDIGHVHLKVSDLEQSLRFWRDVLGFEVQETVRFPKRLAVTQNPVVPWRRLNGGPAPGRLR